MTGKTRVLILGCTGMLGHKLLERFSARGDFDVFGTARSTEGLKSLLPPHIFERIRPGVDVDNFDNLIRALSSVRPDAVINCVGIIKQLRAAGDPFTAISINALLPHRISLICRTAGARLIHISTDCVFSGSRGNYRENDPSDATDLYGRSKYLGEVQDSHCVTLRTSIIGHELHSRYGLVEWFLAQEGEVRGFARAIYTGFPTVEMARIIGDHVIPRPELSGLYHVSSDRISKYELLRLIAERYGKRNAIHRDEEPCLDRALDSSAFRGATGYHPPSWPEMVDAMCRDHLASRNDRNSVQRE